jgi:hypothetical protein
MTASLTWLCGHVAILRVHPSGQAAGGDWTWAAAVIRRGWFGRSVEMQAACRAPTPEEWRAAEAALKAAGFRWRVYNRQDGRRIEKPL